MPLTTFQLGGGQYATFGGRREPPTEHPAVSARATAWAWRQAIDDPSAKLVLLSLADEANDDGECFTSTRDAIAARCGVSVATVKRRVAQLAAAGLLEAEQQRVEHGRRSWNLYRLALPPREPYVEVNLAPDEEIHRGSLVTRNRKQALKVLELSSSPEPQEPVLKDVNTQEDQQTPKPIVDSPLAAVRDRWLSHTPVLPAHRPSYFADTKIRRKVDAAVRVYGVDDVCWAIDAYASVLDSSEHFFDYRWTLGDFLTRGLSRFVPELDPLENFRSRQPARLTRSGEPVVSAEALLRRSQETRRREIQDDARRGRAAGRDSGGGAPVGAIERRDDPGLRELDPRPRPRQG